MIRREIPPAEKLPGGPEEEPVFAEPWEAQAFALAVKLQADGHFTAAEWADALGHEIKAAQACGDPDDGSTYYRHWLAALRHILREKGLLSDGDVPNEPAGASP